MSLSNYHNEKASKDTSNIENFHERVRQAGKISQRDNMETLNSDDRANLIDLLREKEVEIEMLSEKANVYNAQRNKIEEALLEAQTIIEQQQAQLFDLRRKAALNEVDAETLKMQKLFGIPNTKKEEKQYNAKDELRTRIETLERHLSETEIDQIRLQSENQYLKHKLEDSNSNQFPKDRPSSLPNFRQGEITDAESQHIEALKTRIVQQEKRHRSEMTQYETEILRLRDERIGHGVSDQGTTDSSNRQEGENITTSAENTEKESERYSEYSLTDRANADPSQLQRIKEERDSWKMYASQLVRSFVENCEEFIAKTSYEEPEFHTVAERRWYDYSMYLLEAMLELAPYRLSEMDLHLLKRTKQSRCPNSTLTAPPTLLRQRPDILSAVDMVQLDRSRKSTSERMAKLALKPLFRRQIAR